MNINQWSLRSRLTIGIVLLSAIGFAASFYGTSAALKGYLIGQIDNELNSVVGGTAMRLDRGAIIQQNNDDLNGEESHHHTGRKNRHCPRNRPVRSRELPPYG